MDRLANPFPGLLPFDEEHSTLFFGRDEETRELAALIGNRRLLAVTGISGSGKSSLMMAGVIPGAAKKDDRAKTLPATPWGRYVKILLSSSEFLFVD
jgi:excinuclease UvrABC ATPase subunit